jgi:hypothetical protein
VRETDVELDPTSCRPRPELARRTPASIETQVMNVTVDSSLDELAAALDASDWLLGRARLIDRLMKQIAIAWIERNGEFDIGSIHYSAGYAYSVKCIDVPQTGRSVLDAAQGDFDQFISALVSQPFKHATVRSIIGRAAHDQLFRATRTSRLNGVPQRVLKRVDSTFAQMNER